MSRFLYYRNVRVVVTLVSKFAIKRVVVVVSRNFVFVVNLSELGTITDEIIRPITDQIIRNRSKPS